MNYSVREGKPFRHHIRHPDLGYLKKSTSKVQNASAKPGKKVKAYSNKLSAAKFTKKGSA